MTASPGKECSSLPLSPRCGAPLGVQESLTMLTPLWETPAPPNVGEHFKPGWWRGPGKDIPSHLQTPIMESL